MNKLTKGAGEHILGNESEKHPLVSEDDLNKVVKYRKLVEKDLPVTKPFVHSGQGSKNGQTQGFKRSYPQSAASRSNSSTSSTSSTSFKGAPSQPHKSPFPLNPPKTFGQKGRHQ